MEILKINLYYILIEIPHASNVLFFVTQEAILDFSAILNNEAARSGGAAPFTRQLTIIAFRDVKRTAAQKYIKSHKKKS